MPVYWARECFSYGEKGHVAKVCTVPLNCLLCRDLGAPASHRLGRKACKPPTNRAKKTTSNSGTVSKITEGPEKRAALLTAVQNQNATSSRIREMQDLSAKPFLKWNMARKKLWRLVNDGPTGPYHTRKQQPLCRCPGYVNADIGSVADLAVISEPCRAKQHQLDLGLIKLGDNIP